MSADVWIFLAHALRSAAFDILMDWLANGQPVEGEMAGVLRAGDVVRRDVPTSRPTEAAGAVRERLRATGWGTCVVVADDGIVVGRVELGARDVSPTASIEALMAEGPTTIRPGTMLAAIAESMHGQKSTASSSRTPAGV